MLKFISTAKNGNTIVGLGLEAGNINRLKAGDPMYFSLEPLGIEGIEVMVIYGDSQEDIKIALRKAGIKGI